MASQNHKIVLDFESPITELDSKIQELEHFAETTEMDLSAQIHQMRERSQGLKREIFSNLSPWERIQVARHPNRPVFSDYLSALFTDTLELHGDMLSRDDGAMWTGFANIDGIRCMLIAHRKGKTTKERIACNFGMPHPEGYRKALLKMRVAEKYGLPIITFIDTPGAYPGIDAERRGQAFAIARNLLEMARIRTPIVTLVLGEGGSGGALGIGIGDRVLMLENAYYSVISPEGCATILWKSVDMASRAAEILKLTAPDLKGFGIIDDIVPEPAGGGHSDHLATVNAVKECLLKHLEAVMAIPTDELLSARYEKQRRIGIFQDESERALVEAKSKCDEEAAS